MPVELWNSQNALIKAFPQWEVDDLMRKRCDEQGHQYENCCSAMFRIYQRCKWCGEER